MSYSYEIRREFQDKYCILTKECFIIVKKLFLFLYISLSEFIHLKSLQISCFGLVFIFILAQSSLEKNLEGMEKTNRELIEENMKLSQNSGNQVRANFFPSDLPLC